MRVLVPRILRLARQSDREGYIGLTRCVHPLCVSLQVDWLANKMREANFTVCSMHGEMPQKEREAIMEQFRAGGSRVLITTDIWGRGLDVQQVRSPFQSRLCAFLRSAT